MPKIAFIAPDRRLLHDGQKIAKDLQIEEEISFYLATLDDAVRLAKSFDSNDVDAIISRYGTANLLLHANLDIPIVEIMVTGQDLAEAFFEAKKRTGRPHPRIIYLAFSNMANDIMRISEILDIDLKVIEVYSPHDITMTIDQLDLSSVDALIGGGTSMAYAQQRHPITQVVHSGECALREAFRSAKKIALARRTEQNRTKEMQTVINAIREGIISIRHDRRIQYVNGIAETILQQSNKDLQDAPIEALFAHQGQLASILPTIDECLAGGQQVLDHLVQLNNAFWFSFSFFPVQNDRQVFELVITIQDVTQVQNTESKIRSEVIRNKFSARYHFDDLLGESDSMRTARQMAKDFAAVDANILLTGESGTGKELFAQSIHNASARASAPFVAVNCAALPMSLLESELFGYTDGAFTGARRKGKPGLFEMAHRGTIFLDEISEMPLYAQSRLLRVLQERQVMRLGDEHYIPIDVRVIVATNKPLAALVQKGKFRQDLFFRLKILTLKIPSLRDRRGDIPFLARHFLAHYSLKYKTPHHWSKDAESFLDAQHWPGNVRELRYFVERLCIIVHAKEITRELLLQYWDEDTEESIPLTPSSEKDQIQKALEEARGNISKTARILGIDRGTLYRRIHRYQISVPRTCIK